MLPSSIYLDSVGMFCLQFAYRMPGILSMRLISAVQFHQRNYLPAHEASIACPKDLNCFLQGYTTLLVYCRTAPILGNTQLLKSRLLILVFVAVVHKSIFCWTTCTLLILIVGQTPENPNTFGWSKCHSCQLQSTPSQGLVWIFPYLGPDAETVSKRSGPCVTPECEGTEWVMTTAPVGYQVGLLWRG